MKRGRLRNSAAPANGNSQLVASAASTRCEASAPEVSCAAALQRCLAGTPSADLCNFDDPPPICLAESEAYDACFVSE